MTLAASDENKRRVVTVDRNGLAKSDLPLSYFIDLFFKPYGNVEYRWSLFDK
jgi:hypothetical protein